MKIIDEKFGEFIYEDMIVVGNMMIAKGNTFYKVNEKKDTIETIHIIGVGSYENEPAVKVRGKNGINSYHINEEDIKQLVGSMEAAQKDLSSIREYRSLPRTKTTVDVLSDVNMAFMEKLHRTNPQMNLSTKIEDMMKKYITGEIS